MDGTPDWRGLVVPASTAATPTTQRPDAQLRADKNFTQQSRQPIAAVTTTAAEHNKRSSAQQAAARDYSPSSPRLASGRTLADAAHAPMDPQRGHSTAREHPLQAARSPEARARAKLERKLRSSIDSQQPSTATGAEGRAHLEPHGRVQQETKNTSFPPERVHSGAQSAAPRAARSASASTGVAAHARSPTREPRAQAQTAPAGGGAARRKTSPRKGKSSHISCTNNALSPRLKQNGGTMELGTPSQCFRKGFGGGYYQKIDPVKLEAFLADFSAPYRKIVHQPLFYGDGAVPAGMIRATLSQCMQRGFGVGSMQLAKRILKERKQATGK